jgi:hypothetical protein
MTIPVADAFLIGLGSGWPEHPDRGGRAGWLEHIMWGVDQAVQTIRLLRIGHVLGAASVARHQLERWTTNMANYLSLSRNENESTSDYIDRVWSGHQETPDSVSPGDAWKELSEWLHSRSHADRLFELELDTARFDQNTADTPAEIVGLRELIVHTVDVTLRQVKGCIGTLLRENDKVELAEKVNYRVELKTQPDEEDGLFDKLLQVDFLLVYDERGEVIVGHGHMYRSFIEHDEVQDHLSLHSVSPFSAQGALLERRARAVEFFRVAARNEERLAGEALEFAYLGSRLFRYIAISEAALLTASWSSHEQQQNALASASA